MDNTQLIGGVDPLDHENLGISIDAGHFELMADAAEGRGIPQVNVHKWAELLEEPHP